MTTDKERIAELERENAQHKKEILVYHESRLALINAKDELERKLAEQQAILQSLKWLQCGTDWNNGTHANIHRKQTEKILEEYFKCENSKELNTIISKAREESRKEAVPEGWQVVPKTLTPEMQQALADETEYRVDKALWKLAYKAMLAAAPKPMQSPPRAD